MNVIIWLIFGWLIGELFHMTMWEWCKIKFNLDHKKVKTILIFVGIALLIALIGSGFYRVTSTENIVLTKLSGNKQIIDNYGIKFSLLSSREVINMQKQIIKFPYGADMSYDMITSDEKPISLHSFLQYQVKDVKSYALDNTQSEDKISISLASETKEIFQGMNYDSIFKNLEDIKKKMKEDLSKTTEKYGIEVIDVDIQLADVMSVKNAKADAEAQKIKSASLKESYLNEANALKIKYDALDDKEFIKYMEFINAIKEGKIQTILIPQNTITSFNIS